MYNCIQLRRLYFKVDILNRKFVIKFTIKIFHEKICFNNYIETTFSLESSTHQPVNRGAARQIYGSGSLRQTGSSPIPVGTTTIPSSFKNKERDDEKNNIREEERHKVPYEHNPEHEGTSIFTKNIYLRRDLLQDLYFKKNISGYFKSSFMKKKY